MVPRILTLTTLLLLWGRTGCIDEFGHHEEHQKCVNLHPDEECEEGRRLGKCTTIGAFAANCEKTCADCCDDDPSMKCEMGKARGECNDRLNPIGERCRKTCRHCINY